MTKKKMKSKSGLLDAKEKARVEATRVEKQGGRHDYGEAANQK